MVDCQKKSVAFNKMSFHTSWLLRFEKSGQGFFELLLHDEYSFYRHEFGIQLKGIDYKMKMDDYWVIGGKLRK